MENECWAMNYFMCFKTKIHKCLPVRTVDPDSLGSKVVAYDLDLKYTVIGSGYRIQRLFHKDSMDGGFEGLMDQHRNPDV